jgi:hypothetical protein
METIREDLHVRAAAGFQIAFAFAGGMVIGALGGL